MPSLHNIIYMVSLQQTSISIVCTMCVYIYLINSTFLTIVYWATIYTPTGIVYNIRNSTNRHNIMWCDDRIVMIQEVWIMTQEYLLIITMCLLIHVQGHTWHTQMVFRVSIRYMHYSTHFHWDSSLSSFTFMISTQSQQLSRVVKQNIPPEWDN